MLDRVAVDPGFLVPPSKFYENSGFLNWKLWETRYVSFVRVYNT
jgi:hypothetical protein